MLPQESRWGQCQTLEEGGGGLESIFKVNLAEMNVLDIEQEGKGRTSDGKLNVWIDMLSRNFDQEKTELTQSFRSSLQTLRHQGLVSWKTIFSRTGGVGRGMVSDDSSAHYIYFCYYISSISDRQALDPRGWEPLVKA